MNNYMVDVETLDVQSSAVILSIAVIKFGLDEVPVYEDLLNRALFVKFNALQQRNEYGNTMDESTLKWWGKQATLVKQKSFFPNLKFDVSAIEGLAQVRRYCELPNKHVRFWARGCMDQSCLDNLSRKAFGDLLIPYNAWYDVRTAIDLTCENAANGYCPVPGFDSKSYVIKHDPVHDCAYDIMQLLSNNLLTK